MVESIRRLVETDAFHRIVIGLIVTNALVMGLETWPALALDWAPALHAANMVIQGLFLLELALRIAAHGRRPLDFFRNGWNVFDFLVVALSLLPAAGSLATIARLARVLRVGRLISGMPELRLIISTMLRSIPSMGHVVTLLGLLIYVYGVLGFHLFGRVDPEHWGTLDRAAQTLFVIITLEGWVDIMQKSSEATPWAWVYYTTFIIIAVFVVINLFIAVVINNLEKVRQEQDEEVLESAGTSEELRRMALRIAELTAAIKSLEQRS